MEILILFVEDFQGQIGGRRQYICIFFFLGASKYDKVAPLVENENQYMEN